MTSVQIISADDNIIARLPDAIKARGWLYSEMDTGILISNNTYEVEMILVQTDHPYEGLFNEIHLLLCDYKIVKKIKIY